ncbi:hypothetical protein HDU86_000448 [Geranomyces michiganensis]|nr:hypothetical protein HDU86_000448 [Geranomyces michiganensis]
MDSAVVPVSYKGDNVLWLDNILDKVIVDGVSVSVNVTNVFMDRGTYQQTLSQHIEGFQQGAKIQKDVDTEISKTKLDGMMSYFDGLERKWVAAEETEEADGEALPSLRTRSKRLRRMVWKTTSRIRNRLMLIVNDMRVAR